MKMKAEGKVELRRGADGRRIAILGAKKNKMNVKGSITQSSQRTQRERQEIKDNATNMSD